MFKKNPVFLIVLLQIIVAVGVYFLVNYGLSFTDFPFTNDPQSKIWIHVATDLFCLILVLILFVRVEKKRRQVAFYYANAIAFFLIGLLFSQFLSNILINNIEIPESILQHVNTTFVYTVVLILFNIGLRKDLFKQKS